jgi:hypothetical protein
MAQNKRTAVQSVRRDLNEEMVALSRVTKEALSLFAVRIVRLERWNIILSIACGFLLFACSCIAIYCLV